MTMVERVAAILENVVEANVDCVAVAREIIEAMRAPTEAMIDAALSAGPDQGCVVEWQAMIDAALAPEPAR